jgi:transcriptional regulator with XRE-family HTH domain
MEGFGEYLSSARRRRGITGEVFAKKIGLSRATYMRMEAGNGGVAMGSYVRAYFALGVGHVMMAIISVTNDAPGIKIMDQKIPMSIRKRRTKKRRVTKV